MKLINVEFKARVTDPDKLEKKLLEINPVYQGEDHQIDTYFNVPEGRLKLREGNIENALIFYDRENVAAAKKSEIILFKHLKDPSLKEILTRVHGILVVVNKKRRIYFKDNVKFHFDRVKDLGTFIEVEAIDEEGARNIHELREQCDKYFVFFGLHRNDYVKKSYSDLILEKNRTIN